MKPRTRRFLKDTAERTARTFAQGFLGVVTLDALSEGFNAGLREQLSLGALSGLYAVLTSLAAGQVGDKGSASLVE